MSHLNGVTARLEQQQHVFASFCAPNPHAALEFTGTAYDALIFECEHKPWDVPELRDAMQYLLNRRQIFEARTLMPSITPIVRIPPNGGEQSQWHAKQALDLGAYGVIWPHITSAEEAANAVAACRYPGARNDERPGPPGVRGDSPAAAARYWGVTNAEYYQRAGVWGLDSDGEVLVAIMIEDLAGIKNLGHILDTVPGIGLVLVGEGDLSQELGVPRQYEHEKVMECKAHVLKECGNRNVAVGHPHVTTKNVEQVLEDGYRFLMAAPTVTYPALETGRLMTSRDLEK
jgi:4-hydroxy-2-oxoheptanedioate aldolase